MRTGLFSADDLMEQRCFFKSLDYVINGYDRKEGEENSPSLIRDNLYIMVT